MELLTSPPEIFVSLWNAGVKGTIFGFQWTRSNFSFHSSPPPFRKQEWKIRTGNSVSRNSHRRWWHCVQNVSLVVFFLGRSWRLTVDCKIKTKIPKATNEIQRINKYNCFLSDGIHLNLFSGLMSWLDSKNGFLSLFLKTFWDYRGISINVVTRRNHK
jgi:hypothetical protein